MRIAYDCEFLEDGHTIELISIGMIAEDGRELYLCNRDAPWKRIHKHEWLVNNVLPGLPRLHGDRRMQASVRRNPAAVDFNDPRFVKHQTIAERVKDFVQATPDVELWADYCAYDHVALCQLYGPMITLPDGFPMWTHDFQQVHEAAGRPELPEQTSGLHNALADARHLMECMRAVTARAEEP
jgi:hypothetical protein